MNFPEGGQFDVTQVEPLRILDYAVGYRVLTNLA